MYPGKHLKESAISPVSRIFRFVTLLGLLSGLLYAGVGWAQSSSSPQSSSSGAQSQAEQQKQQEQQPAEAGGPSGETGPIAVPKKKESEEPPPPPKPTPADNPQYSLHVDVPVVTVDARVVQKDGRPLALPESAKQNFRVWEDGVEQKVQSVTTSQAPITAVLLVEFASTNYNFMYDALNASYTFASNLQPKDWVAVIEFDMKSHILVDFTQDKNSIFGALNMLQIPGLRDTNIFDAMYDTLDRLERVPGHKELVVVASGRDTFSKITLDTLFKKIKATPNVTIYTISTGKALLNWVEARGAMNPEMSAYMMNYYQADNEMRTYAKMTGGHWYAPMLEGELPDIFREIAGAIRNQYTISYKPTNTKQDGTYRKLRVELLGPDGKPLEIKDQKNHDVKYQIIAREGYTAKHEVE